MQFFQIKESHIFKNSDGWIVSFIGLFILGILSICLLSFVGCDYCISEGFRDGTVQKFSYKGLAFKTWEGELAMEGFKRIDNGGSVFEFSVRDVNIATKINNLQPGTRVRLYYNQVLLPSFVTSSTQYIIHKIEIAK